MALPAIAGAITKIAPTALTAIGVVADFKNMVPGGDKDRGDKNPLAGAPGATIPDGSNPAKHDAN